MLFKIISSVELHLKKKKTIDKIIILQLHDAFVQMRRKNQPKNSFVHIQNSTFLEIYKMFCEKEI